MFNKDQFNYRLLLHLSNNSRFRSDCRHWSNINILKGCFCSKSWLATRRPERWISFIMKNDIVYSWSYFLWLLIGVKLRSLVILLIVVGVFIWNLLHFIIVLINYSRRWLNKIKILLKILRVIIACWSDGFIINL